MRDGNYDPLDSLFSTQFYDAAAAVFGGSKPGDKNTYYGALWVGEPLTAWENPH